MQIIEKEFTTKEHGIAGFLSHPNARRRARPAFDPSQGGNDRLYQDRIAQVRQVGL